MLEDGVKPDVSNYFVVISLLGKKGLVAKAFQLFEQMQQLRIHPSKHIFSSLLNACANAPFEDMLDALEKAENLFQQMRVLCPLPLDRPLYNVMMKVYARHCQLESVFRTADIMISDGLKPNNSTFLHILQACLAEKETGYLLALKVWKAMRQLGIVPDTLLYNQLLLICRTCGLDPAVNAWLKEALSSGATTAPSDSQPYENEICSSAEEAVSTDRSRSNDLQVLPLEIKPQSTTERGFPNVLSTMERDGAKPNMKTLSLGLDLMRNVAESDSFILDTLREYRVTADVIFYNDLILRRCKRGDFVSALELLNKMRDQGLQCNENTFYCLAHGCRRRERGLVLFRDSQALGITLSEKTLGLLMRNALSGLDFRYALDVLHMVTSQKLQISCSFLQAIDDQMDHVKQLQLHAKNGDDCWTDEKLLDIVRFRQCLKKVRRFTGEKRMSYDWNVNTDDLRDDWEKPWAKKPQFYTATQASHER
ncbi:unnamed protein product [Soboliphyme baturini]|uniref:PPR_long domain-containing protein n=1 Tax=Soboliphyme baturini TaxID=241478 RepID=A0A183IPS9_9BILA|nr:unnamed protein product [Soboliphyme baturini]